MQGYGTPFHSSVLGGNKPMLKVSERKEVQAPRCTKSKIVRIWHPDDLFASITDADLSKTTSFKSFKVDDTTRVVDSRNFVAGKLLLQEFDDFSVYALQDGAKKVLHPETLLYPLLELKADIKLAFLSTGEDRDVGSVGTSVFGVGDDFDVRENASVAHRRLLNQSVYSGYSDVSFNFEGTKIASFRCLIEVRCPVLLELDEMIKKRKEKVTARGTSISIKVREICFLTPKVLRHILDYIYSDNIDLPAMSISEILEVQRAAEKMGSIKRLVWLCSNFLFSSLGNHNVHEMIRDAYHYEIENVKNFSVSHAHANWGDFSSHKIGLDLLGLDLFQELVISLQFSKHDPISKNPIPPSTYAQDLRRLYEDMQFTDAHFELSEQNSSIPFHRSIFAAHEPSLAQVFQDKKDTTKVFKILPVSLPTFRFLQEYVYCGHTEISAASACEIIEVVVQKFSFEHFRDYCEKVVEENLNCDLVLRILRLTYYSWNSQRERLTTSTREACLRFISENFASINIHSIRSIKPQGIQMAHDILDTIHYKKRNAKQRKVSQAKTRGISFN